MRISPRTALIVKVLISLSALTVIMHSIDPDVFTEALSQVVVWPIVIAFWIVLVAQMISAWRWKIFATVLQMTLSLKSAVRYYFSGLFFSLFLPGILGGDALRIWFLNREVGGGRFLIAGYSVLAERINGLFGLTLLAALAGWQCVENIPWLWWGSVTLLTLILYLFWPVTPRLLRWLHKCHLPVTRWIPDTLLIFWRPEGRWWPVLWLSLAGQTGYALAALLVGLSLGLDLPWLFYLFMTTTVALIAVIPVSINGLGVREGLYVFQMSWWNVPIESSAAFGLLTLGVTAAVASVGGVIFLTTGGRGGGENRREDAS